MTKYETPPNGRPQRDHGRPSPTAISMTDPTLTRLTKRVAAAFFILGLAFGIPISMGITWLYAHLNITFS